MLFGLPFVPSVAGVTFAAAAVVAGAPLFSTGLRALRLRRALKRVHDAPLDERPTGFVRVRGRVALESPLFAPLSGKPCAGFRLEASGVDVPVSHAIEDVRPFRLVANGTMAQVTAARGAWDLDVTDERVIDPDEPLSERLMELIQSMPEACWVRQSGRRLKLVERALLSGVECHVMGYATRGRDVQQWQDQTEWVRTGTDDEPIAVTTRIPVGTGEPALFVGPADHLEYMRVSTTPVSVQDVHVPWHHTLGVIAGPLVTFVGLVYLAIAADHWRALRTF